MSAGLVIVLCLLSAGCSQGSEAPPVEASASKQPAVASGTANCVDPPDDQRRIGEGLEGPAPAPIFSTDLLGVDLSADGALLRITFLLRTELMFGVPDGSSLQLSASLIGPRSFRVAVQGYPGTDYAATLSTADGDPISSDLILNTSAAIDGSPAVTVDVSLEDLEGLSGQFEWTAWSEYQTPVFLFQDFCPGADASDRAVFPAPKSSAAERETPTTTSQPRDVDDLVLASDGLGVVGKGATLSDARQRLTSELARPPDTDETLPCSYGGPEVHVLRWGPLSAFFEIPGDDTAAQFVGWLVDSSQPGLPDLDDLRTADGLFVGSTVEDINGVEHVEIYDGQDPASLGFPTLTIGEGDAPIVGVLSDAGGGGEIVALAQGVPCTEDGFNIAS